MHFSPVSVLISLLPLAKGSLWSIGRKTRDSTAYVRLPSPVPVEPAVVPSARVSPSELLQAGMQRPLIYQIALHELQELEAEPLCHRVAARLLVNNCQLLDGKDEAMVLTDSGREARDFVDAYAASLAICDLEKGSFHIPSACAAFREPVLSTLPLVRDAAQLHVSPAQIKACLTGLGDSASAWNTWVSYSHKAVRFCEAARADHEKTQNILIFQRLTRIMAKLTDDVEAELQKKADALERATRQASERIDQLTPQIDYIWLLLGRLGGYVEGELDPVLQQASHSAHEGLQAAEDLRRMLAVMSKTVLESSSQVAHAHEQSMERVSERVNSEMGLFASTMLSLMSSSVALQSDLEMSRRHAEDLSVRQGSLEQGMQRLTNMEHTLSSKYNDHAHLLAAASNMTNDILDTLEVTQSSASSMQNLFFPAGSIRGWWPFIVCPAASLVLGSYGLPPSLARNIGLVIFGEVLGFLVTSYDRLSQAAFLPFTRIVSGTNSTF